MCVCVRACVHSAKRKDSLGSSDEEDVYITSSHYVAPAPTEAATREVIEIDVVQTTDGAYVGLAAASPSGTGDGKDDAVASELL